MLSSGVGRTHMLAVLDNVAGHCVLRLIVLRGIVTSTSSGKALLGLLAVIAEFEADIRKERQVEGIKKAKDRGVAFGRTAKLSGQQVSELRERGATGSRSDG